MIYEAFNNFATFLTAAHSVGSGIVAIGSAYRPDFNPTTTNRAIIAVIHKDAIVNGMISDTARMVQFEVTGRAGGNLTVVPISGYSDQSFPAGSHVYGLIAAEHINSLSDRVTDIEENGGGGGGTTLPPLTGQAGKFLTNNGTLLLWSTVDALPSQTGNNGKFLKTNGTVSSWATLVFSDIASLPTTLAGYGITNAYTKTEVDSALFGKADTATTLAGYGIANAYTKSEVDSLLTGKANTATTLAGYGITNAYTKTESDANFAPVSHQHAAAAITTGTIATARLGSGTADTTTVLRGDQTYAAGVTGPWSASNLKATSTGSGSDLVRSEDSSNNRLNCFGDGGSAYIASRTATLSATEQLTLTSKTLQLLDPNGSNRIVKMPNVTSTDKDIIFTVRNTATSGTATLTMQTYGGTQISVPIPFGMSMTLHWDGTTWRAI